MAKLTQNQIAKAVYCVLQSVSVSIVSDQYGKFSTTCRDENRVSEYKMERRIAQFTENLINGLDNCEMFPKQVVASISKALTRDYVASQLEHLCYLSVRIKHKSSYAELCSALYTDIGSRLASVLIMETAFDPRNAQAMQNMASGILRNIRVK